MPRHGSKPCLTDDDWQLLRAEIAVQSSLRDCPEDQIDFVVSTAIFAAWVAETLDRASDEAPGCSVTGWATRMLHALIWSVQNRRSGSMVDGESYEDAEAWDLLLTVEDSIPIFIQVSKRDAEVVQRLSTASGRVSDRDLKQARRTFLLKVVPALHAVYGTEN